MSGMPSLALKGFPCFLCATAPCQTYCSAAENDVNKNCLPGLNSIVNLASLFRVILQQFKRRKSGAMT
jgi:hypothetical protein